MTSPPVFRPSQPVSSSWAPQGGWYNAGQQSQQAPNSQQAAQQAQADAQRWDQYVQQVVAAINAANTEGNQFKKDSLRAQYEDAEKGRQNAWKIAELSSQTSRYGTDQQTEVSLARLKEDQRQFDSNHALEQQKFGLDQKKYGLNVAEAYTNFASTPDKMFALGDFEEGLGRVGQGLGPTPYGSEGQPHAKTWEDWSALAGYDSLPAVQAGAASSAAPATGMAEGPGSGTAGGGVDPRIKAAKGIIDAIPPSDADGHDSNNWAALQAIEGVFRASRPGTLERMRPGQRQAFTAGLSRLGYYAPDAINQIQRNGVGQGAVNRA